MSGKEEIVVIDRQMVDIAPAKAFVETTNPQDFGKFLLANIKIFADADATKESQKMTAALAPFPVSPEGVASVEIYKIFASFMPEKLPLLKGAAIEAFMAWQREDGIKTLLELAYFFNPFRYYSCEDFAQKMLDALSDPDLLRRNESYFVSRLVTEIEYAAYRKHPDLRRAPAFLDLERTIAELRIRNQIEFSQYKPDDASGRDDDLDD